MTSTQIQINLIPTVQYWIAICLNKAVAHSTFTNSHLSEKKFADIGTYSRLVIASIVQLISGVTVKIVESDLSSSEVYAHGVRAKSTLFFFSSLDSRLSRVGNSRGKATVIFIVAGHVHRCASVGRLFILGH